MAVSTEERRIVTVLFADMAGSTELGEELDPEEMRGLLARYYAVARETVTEHGGTVEKFIGDAVMAVFGLPTAHGDDPDRAVAAALALGCFNPLSIPANGQLNVQSGLPFGLGFGTAISADAFGTTLVLQPGLYNLHFEAPGVQLNNPPATVSLKLNGQPGSVADWVTLPGNASGIIIGDNFVRISAANTTANFVVSQAMMFTSGCLVSLTKLQ